jgi:hypothetical protein
LDPDAGIDPLTGVVEEELGCRQRFNWNEVKYFGNCQVFGCGDCREGRKLQSRADKAIGGVAPRSVTC